MKTLDDLFSKSKKESSYTPRQLQNLFLEIKSEILNDSTKVNDINISYNQKKIDFPIEQLIQSEYEPTVPNIKGSNIDGSTSNNTNNADIDENASNINNINNELLNSINIVKDIILEHLTSHEFFDLNSVETEINDKLINTDKNIIETIKQKIRSVNWSDAYNKTNKLTVDDESDIKVDRKLYENLFDQILNTMITSNQQVLNSKSESINENILDNITNESSSINTRHDKSKNHKDSDDINVLNSNNINRIINSDEIFNNKSVRDAVSEMSVNESSKINDETDVSKVLNNESLKEIINIVNSNSISSDKYTNNKIINDESEVVHRNTGGDVPGVSDVDSVPALLTPGEFVINKKSTQKYKNILEQINDEVLPKNIYVSKESNKFENGGIIPHSNIAKGPEAVERHEIKQAIDQSAMVNSLQNMGSQKGDSASGMLEQKEQMGKSIPGDSVKQPGTGQGFNNIRDPAYLMRIQAWERITGGVAIVNTM